MTSQAAGGSRVTYVALGDSISIDEYAGGPGRGGASLLAANRDDDFPDWRGRDLASRLPDFQWRLLATDGATTSTVLDRQLPRLRSLAERADGPRIVTLTVGGNDLLGYFGDTRAARRAVEVIRERVERILVAVGQAVGGDVQVVVGTVYDPSDGTGDASRLGLPHWPDAVEVLEELNLSLATAARQYGAAVADIHGRFLGHGLKAGDPTQGHPRPADRNLWYCNLIEPNQWGASGVRSAFWDALTLVEPSEMAP